MRFPSESFWRDKRVFVTGHTGFKGSWLCQWLGLLGAHVSGFALSPRTTPNLFDLVSANSDVDSTIGDINNGSLLSNTLISANPHVVLHLAAQPLVRESYDSPVATFQTNVMGTVNVLEAARRSPSVKAVVVVTTDKCYENQEWCWGYRENDRLGGHDPYSNSKACAELVVQSYRESFFRVEEAKSCFVATARAGNVIGGGDWSVDRLIPDAVRAFSSETPLLLRSPKASRPWQHVLEPLLGYLLLAEDLFNHGVGFDEAWNFGPGPEGNQSVASVVDLASRYWGKGARWELEGDGDRVHEANLLMLDSSKAKSRLNWNPVWALDGSIRRTIRWYQACNDGKDMSDYTRGEILEYCNPADLDRRDHKRFGQEFK